MSIFYITSQQPSISHSYFLYTSTWIAKAVIHLQTEGGRMGKGSNPSHRGVKYSRSRPKTMFIKDASLKLNTIPPRPFPLRGRTILGLLWLSGLWRACCRSRSSSKEYSTLQTAEIRYTAHFIISYRFSVFRYAEKGEGITIQCPLQKKLMKIQCFPVEVQYLFGFFFKEVAIFIGSICSLLVGKFFTFDFFIEIFRTRK